VVPRVSQIEGKRILLAVDGSRYSDAAASAAISIARYLQAPILAVCAVHSEFKEKRQQEANMIIKRITTLISKKGIIVEGRVLNGRPAEVIVEAAKNQGIDLIVMGSHGRTGLERVLMGSVSDRVIGHADCAVLVVKA
jgi:hypothetical protein